MSVKIYHNPRCSKSRETLALLTQHQIEPEVVEYLKTPPIKTELGQLLKMLGLSARDLLRNGEQEYQTYGLADPKLSEDKILELIVQHPKLLQRPIVVSGNKARIGRPPEIVLEIL